jgi:SAM-dependent methyltransferase
VKAPVPAPAFRHWVDFCTPYRLQGWSTAPWIDVAVNDGRIARLTPNLVRPDVLEAGFSTGAGFDFFLPRPLWLDDSVSVHGPDGSVVRTALDEVHAVRIQELTRYLDPARQVGLEIGPLDRPVIPKPRFRVYYLDQAPREQLLARYRGQGIDDAGVAEPDFVAGDAAFVDIVGGLRFDYALASHVIEHVPDMIGWLWQIWSVLRDGGVLALAIPHAEHTFDARRRLSTLAELADAWFGRFTRPSPRQIIDARLGSVLYEGGDLLRGSFEAFHLANHSRKTGLYVDLHCNTFTPDSFAQLLAGLDRCELLGFELLSIGTRPGNEFTAHLRKRADKRLPDHISP